MKIDLRSDTMTKPTQGMLQAMFNAEVGDDVFGEDPTVRKLEEYAASLLGMEAGLFCPSGTMTNQIAIKLHTQPQDEVICDKRSHIYNYEGGGVAYNSFCTSKLLDGPYGKLTAGQIKESINPDDIHLPRTRLVSLENTVNKGGGSCYTIAEIEPIAQLCKEEGLRLHLDGARLLNATVAVNDQTEDYGKCFDTISLCLSKGLGAPVGSVLLGSHAHIKQAKRIRKVLGGGMRQAGYLAAAGLYALENHIERLAEDHEHAQELASVLTTCGKVSEVLPVATNIIIFKLQEEMKVDKVLDALATQNLLAAPFGKQHIRFVTYLDISKAMVENAKSIIADVLK